MKLRRVLIVDGYTDEPAGLGVPPYIDTYPREIYGALKLASKDNEAYYLTIDDVRKDRREYVRMVEKVDAVIVIAGALVPGRYLSGEPLRDPKEIEYMQLWSDKPLYLVGPAARFGLGGLGGTRTKPLEGVVRIRHNVAKWVYEAAKYGIEYASDYEDEKSYDLRSKALIRGSEVVLQHPNMRIGNLVAEIETYRGCARWVTGGCSFCLDPFYGRPKVRKIEDIVEEVGMLYRFGVRNIRLGRQSDILVYGSKDLGLKEWPKPEPEELRKLFYGIRSRAPSLITLHIDNVNPGTIARNPRESEEALKVVVEYHTPGDVAALGIESVDPKVVKLNNLKVDKEGALKAVEIINKVGAKRGWNGLPHLLPGLNFIAGLPGESKETWKINEELMNEIEKRGLMVRRVNIRKLSILEGSKVSKMISKVKVGKGYEGFRRFVMEWQKRMLRRVLPANTVVRNVVVEKVERGVSYARYPGSYPITFEIPRPMEIGRWVSVVVKRHHARSVVAEVL
ncbi:radical SAM protein [Ignicoccus pacificus DSM 13166]|uniref:Radical SAM protein n=1 Tax=Ignicoccus pacificus DSM 13166 TaxID=940294 RepID=A0A977PKF2_9CREN|nr:radical SAM protein [Ignicoccus pacificus DSM 13166]